MAKFCTLCGKELKDGKECDCKKTTSTVANNNQSVVNEILNLIKGMFTSPVDTMKSFINENNFNNALISIGVSAIAAAICVCLLLKELFPALLGVMGMASGTSSLGLYSMGSLMDQIEIPYVKIALITIVVVIATEALIAAIAYLMSAKLFKSETSYKKMLTWLGANAGLLTVLYLITGICALIDFRLALLVYVMGSMLNTYYMYKGLNYACDTDENKLGYVLMPAVLITTLVIGYLLPKIMM